jgi:hypothetical protein
VAGRCGSAPRPAPHGSTGTTLPSGPRRWDGVGSVYLSYYPDLAVPGAVEAVLGREPRDFSDYARRTAATGVWNGSAAAA